MRDTSRWRRYPTDSLQNAVNRYAFAEFRQRLGRDAAIETEARVERNDARAPRFDYRRYMLASTISTPLGERLAFDIGMQYRMQEYSGRFVRINKVERQRVDHRLARPRRSSCASVRQRLRCRTARSGDARMTRRR